MKLCIVSIVESKCSKDMVVHPGGVVRAITTKDEIAIPTHNDVGKIR
jgi:hypothetical protein